MMADKELVVKRPEDIELVIKIPEEVYKKAQEIPNAQWDAVWLAIKHGSQLPKGHGRIGDLDALEQEMINGIKAGNYEDGYDDYSHINNIDDCVVCVRCADAIIEADREVEE
jgi:hypothetical protein